MTKLNKIIAYSVVSFVVIVLLLYFLAWRAPADFPLNSIYSVGKGTSLSETATGLFNQKIIRSEFWFKSFLVLFGGPKGLQAGDYVLPENEGVIHLAYRLAHGDYELTSVRITIPEGENVREMSQLISQKLNKINPEFFIKTAGPDEGYLFPDTYFFLPNASAEDIIKVLKDNFQIKIKLLDTQINNFGKPLADIIKMASIVEEEARSTDVRRTIAGILWKRLALGIPLQVDSSFKYINGKTTLELTTDDLKINSPYNSYLYKGLPPTPICNPGLDAITATISPIKTNYLYFLTDKEGNMHYAKTYAEHLKNKELYL